MITPTDLQCDSPYLLMESAIVATEVLQVIRMHAEVLAKSRHGGLESAISDEISTGQSCFFQPS
jgi:hypothetical protein